MTAHKPRPVPPPSDGARAAAPRDLHSRFIPREELSSFATWAFGDVSGLAGAGTATGNAAPPPREAEPPSDPAELLAQQLKAARQSGYQDGYRDGLVALEGFKQSFASQTTAQVGVLVSSIGTQLDALQQQMARTVATTAAALARQVLRSELEARPECIATVAEEAIDALLLSARHIVIRIHPDDRALITGNSAEAIAARGARLVGDASIGRGGCLVESDIGLVDATIDERWRRAAAALGSDLAWQAPPPAPAAAPTATPAGATAPDES